MSKLVIILTNQRQKVHREKPRMLGKQLKQQQQQQQKDKQMKKSFYQQLEQKDMVKLLDEKDQIIRKLEFRIQKLQKQNDQLSKPHPGKGGNNADFFYKQKLQLEIKENQAAFELLLNLSNRMSKITEMLKLSPEILSEDSSEMKNILRMMGGVGQEQVKSQILDLDESDDDNMQNLREEVNKKIQELEMCCDTYHKAYIKMQKECSGIEKKFKDSKRLFEQELKAAHKQLKQARTGREHFKNLLQKNEQQKKQLLHSIANCLDAKMRSSISTMTRQDLIQYVKKLTFRITELETKKTQILRENQKIKTADLQKYKKILNQVKQVKQMSRIGQSMM